MSGELERIPSMHNRHRLSQVREGCTLTRGFPEAPVLPGALERPPRPSQDQGVRAGWQGDPGNTSVGKEL